MKVLFYKWSVCNEEVVTKSLQNMGINVISYRKKCTNFDIDADIMTEVLFLCHKEKADCIFTLNYYPLLSNVAQTVGIPYISWVQDSPLFTLYSPSKNLSCNFQFVFDKEEVLRLKSAGSERCFNTTLASDPDIFSTYAQKDSSFSSDVCFLGNLYNSTDFEQAHFSREYYEGYVDGLINSQKGIYGINFIEPALSEELANEILIASQNAIPSTYSIPPNYAAAYVLERKVTGLERIMFLKSIGENYKLTIYTTSKPEPDIRASYKEYADYSIIMPKVFFNAKINLHFSPRSIHSGVSLRVFDVLSCRGFLMTTWQPEIIELFNDGEDLVVFDSKQDMLEKINYYLLHDKERESIAQSGYEKIRSLYSNKTILSNMFNKAGLVF